MLNDADFTSHGDHDPVVLDDVMAELDRLRHRVEQLEAVHNAASVPAVAPQRSRLLGRLQLSDRLTLLRGSLIRHGGSGRWPAR